MNDSNKETDQPRNDENTKISGMLIQIKLSSLYKIHIYFQYNHSLL